MDTTEVLAAAGRSMQRAQADVAEQQRKLERSKTLMRTFDKIVAENNLAELIYAAFSDAYRKNGK